MLVAVLIRIFISNYMKNVEAICPTCSEAGCFSKNKHIARLETYFLFLFLFFYTCLWGSCLHMFVYMINELFFCFFLKCFHLASFAGKRGKSVFGKVVMVCGVRRSRSKKKWKMKMRIIKLKWNKKMKNEFNNGSCVKWLHRLWVKSDPLHIKRVGWVIRHKSAASYWE
jgi:hypothetical protein